MYVYVIKMRENLITNADLVSDHICKSWSVVFFEFGLFSRITNVVKVSSAL